MSLEALEVISKQEASFLAQGDQSLEDEDTLENETCERLASLLELASRRPLTEKPQ